MKLSYFFRHSRAGWR